MGTGPGPVVQDRWSKTGGPEQVVQDRWSRTSGSGRAVWDECSRTSGTGQVLQDDWSRISALRHVVQDECFRTNSPGQAKKAKWGAAAPLPSLRPSALILSPCRYMFRSWPEESAAHWAGSDEPSEGGGAGGGTAGGGLPLNFQHRSVQDGMSDRFQPPPAHYVHAEGGPAQLNSSSEREN